MGGMAAEESFMAVYKSRKAVYIKAENYLNKL